MIKRFFLLYVFLILAGIGCVRRSSPLLPPRPPPDTPLPQLPGQTKVEFGTPSAIPVTTANQVRQFETLTFKQTDSTPRLIPDDKQPFQIKDGEPFGTFTVTGYARILNEVQDCGEIGECTASSPRVNLVHFVITNTPNALVDKYVSRDVGNSFEGKKWFSLGCLDYDKKEIKSSNHGDAGPAENLISGENFELLTNSSVENPVKLQLTKPYFTGGSGAPKCYSHYRNFKVAR